MKKKLSTIQKEWIKQYEKMTGFSVDHLEYFEKGEITFKDVVVQNMAYLRNWYNDTVNTLER